MTNFNELPPDVRSHIFDLTGNPVQDALISKDNEAVVNEKAQQCFDALASGQDDLPLLLKSSIAQIPKDSSISSLERIKKLYEVLKNAGYDDNVSFRSLQPEQIKNAFWELQENQDEALITILPIIAKDAGLANPSITSAKEARSWFEKNLSKISKIQELNLMACDLKVLPTEIGALTELVVLSVASNQLTTLPLIIKQLRNLERLDISNNLLTELPEGLARLSELNDLNASNNQLSKLPLGLGQLTELEWLDLSDNPLVSIPTELENLKKLKAITIPENPGLVIPSQLKGVVQLSKATIR